MLRSKRHWPYADAFMEVMVPAMTLSEDVLAREREVVDVLDDEGAIVGVVHIIRHVELAFLESLFVDPEVMGRGYGRLLFERAVGIGRGWGMGVLEFESDSQRRSTWDWEPCAWACPPRRSSRDGLSR